MIREQAQYVETSVQLLLKLIVLLILHIMDYLALFKDHSHLFLFFVVMGFDIMLFLIDFSVIFSTEEAPMPA